MAWIYDSPIGRFAIDVNSDMQFELSLTDMTSRPPAKILLGYYDDPNKAARDVASQATGWITWDMLSKANPPAYLSGWEVLRV